jgi:uncharacterized protein (TIGR03067 family)
VRHSTHLATVLTIVLVLAGKSFGQGQANPDKPKSDDKTAQQTLVGGWSAESVSMAAANGKRKNLPNQGNLLVVMIREKTFTLRAGDKVQMEASYTLDPKQVPATIDMKSPDGNLLGIYKLDGDHLTIALNDAAEGRPNDIKSESCGLLFALNRVEGFEIWMVNVDGTNPHPFFVSPEYYYIGAPTWSPDGSKIAFDAGSTLSGDHAPHLYVVDASGSGQKDLGTGRQSSWSPDGKRLVFSGVSPDRQGLCVIGADGAGFERLIPDAQWGKWSPAKDEIAYTHGTDLYIYNLATKEHRALITEGYQRISTGFNWSPDGQWFCFKGNSDGRFHTAVIHREGKDKGFRVILSRDAMPDVIDYDCNYSWLKPDGKSILASMATQKCHNHQLYLLDPEGKVAPQLIPGQDPTRWLSTPTSSPDGKRIIFLRRPGKEPPSGMSFLPALKSSLCSN